MKIYFVGAGPGDPELITVKGQRLLEKADVVIYAGSLVNPALLASVPASAEVYNSASMTLEEVLQVMIKAAGEGKLVVRLHTGDPALFGAIQEQIDALSEQGITSEVVPGVSSLFAAAAALQQEYTLPGVTQTVIITRLAGRTPVPESESLARLAEHRAAMCVFLSVHLLPQVVQALQSANYPPDTPIAVVYKASWPDEVIVRGTLEDIAERVETAGISKTALILVGNFLGKDYTRSRLYDPGFTHGYRGE